MASVTQQALLYMSPSEDWLASWEQVRGGSPFEFLPAPMVGLLREQEPVNIERLQAKLDDLRTHLPITLTVSSVEDVYSPSNSGSVLTVFFEESLEEVRATLGPFGPNHHIYQDGKFKPHMILAKPQARSQANRRFISYIKTYMHGAKIEFDSIDLQVGDSWSPGLLYESNVESFDKDSHM
jgi:hypothetical protein